MVLLSESDDLTKTYQRLHKQEKELHRKEQVDVASRAGKKHVPVEPFHTKHKSSFGWRKHPEEM